MHVAAFLRQAGGRTAHAGPCAGAVTSGTTRGAGQAGLRAQVEQARGGGKRQQRRRCCGCGMRSVREFAGPGRPAKGGSAKGDRALAAGPRHTQQCAPRHGRGHAVLQQGCPTPDPCLLASSSQMIRLLRCEHRTCMFRHRKRHQVSRRPSTPFASHQQTQT